MGSLKATSTKGCFGLSCNGNRKLEGLFLALLALWILASPVQAQVIYVDANAVGADNGSSWTDAYKYIQDALADANSDPNVSEIWVAQGIYKPDQNSADPNGSGDREATFQLINDVNLMGGFAGFGEADPNARDVDLYETILSGDLDGNDANVSNPADLLDEPTRAENSYHVLTGSGTDANAVLDGFTITAGNASETVNPNKNGAGMYGGSPTVLNCTFSNNSAYGRGGAMYTWGAVGSTISNCTFVENSAEDGGGIAGGNMRLTNCTFSGNLGVGLGGGMWIIGDPILTNCVFNSNAVRGFSVGGGGMCILARSNPILINCTFNGNVADGDYGFGGGIFTQAFEDTIQSFINCTFSGNSASKDGGGFDTAHCYATFTNCTFSENSAGRDGGAFCCYSNGGTADFNNSIFWGNTAYGEGPQIAAKTSFLGWTITVSYCDIQGGKVDIYDPSVYLVWDDVNNIKVDPCFVDADGADDTAGTEDDDLHVLWDSPCINAGDPSFVFDVNERDIDGEPRVMVGRVDMGADEVGEKQADFTRNGRIDFEDLGVFVQAWLTTPIDIDWYILCDLEEDEQIDFKDYADFAADWQWQASWYEP